MSEPHRQFDYEKEKTPTKESTTIYDDNDESDYDYEDEDQIDEECGKDDTDITALPPTPTYPKKLVVARKNEKSQSEKNAISRSMEDSDSDSFNVVQDENIGGYNPIGEINPNTRRIVVKGSNKSYYGVGPKPVAT